MKEEAIKDNSDADSNVSSIVELVREFVGGNLNSGAKGAEIAFALAYVATEMGFALSSDPVNVFPVVLKGISSAAAQWSFGCIGAIL